MSLASGGGLISWTSDHRRMICQRATVFAPSLAEVYFGWNLD
jgi:hypothetical protein